MGCCRGSTASACAARCASRATTRRCCFSPHAATRWIASGAWSPAAMTTSPSPFICRSSCCACARSCGAGTGTAAPPPPRPPRCCASAATKSTSEAQHRGGRGGGGAAVPVPAPQDRAHAQQELLQVKGLGEIVIAAGLQAPHPIHGVPARGEKQHRRVVTLLAQRAAHAEAVDPRQHHIEHDERASLLAQPRERLLAVCGRAHLVALGAQVLHDAGGEVQIVLHHQHARASRGGAHERCPCAAGQVSTKRAPRPTPSLCALTRPCPRCIRRCTMKSPRPVPKWPPPPRGCRRVNLSKMRAPSAGRKPTPLSRTDSS